MTSTTPITPAASAPSSLTAAEALHYLVLACTSTDPRPWHDNRYAVLPLTAATATLLHSRTQLARAVAAGDASFRGLHYTDLLPTFMSTAQMVAWLGGLPPAVAWSVIVPPCPIKNAPVRAPDGTPTVPPAPVYTPELIVGEHGAWWTGVLENGTVLDTCPVMIDELAKQITIVPDAPAVGIVLQGDAIAHAWIAPTTDGITHTLRQWYALGRLDTDESLDATERRQQDDAFGAPATATIEQIDEWYSSGDDGYGVYLGTLGITPLTDRLTTAEPHAPLARLVELHNAVAGVDEPATVHSTHVPLAKAA